MNTNIEMAYDFKKEQKEIYRPGKKPGFIHVPKMNYIAVEGTGDPNSEDSEYKESIGLLYPIAFTLKMSYKGDYEIDGYFPYVVPPLEGLWWQDNNSGEIDYSNKKEFKFISMIRLPDFITEDDFNWAVTEATEKKNKDFSKVKFFTLEEGDCIQCMHVGPYDNEPETLEKLKQYAAQNNLKPDYSNRKHHEIYLSDPRRSKPENLKTVLRIPVTKID